MRRKTPRAGAGGPGDAAGSALAQRHELAISALQAGARREGEAAFITIQCCVSCVSFAPRFDRRVWALRHLMKFVEAHWDREKRAPPTEYFWMFMANRSGGGSFSSRGGRARRSSAEHPIATKAPRLHSYGLDVHCR